MCFYTSKYNKYKIADEDIICFKKLDSHLHAVFVRYFKYEYNVITPLVRLRKTLNNIYWSDESMYSIYKGYHSYITRDECISHWTDTYAYKCIIPKGTRYLKNNTEYVSEQIIVLCRA